MLRSIATNKIFKAVVMLMMLLTTIFSFGCSSENKHEKFVKLESQIEKSKDNTRVEIEKVRKSKEMGDYKKQKEEIAIIEKHIKEIKPILEDMDKLSKGDKGLEEAMKDHWDYYRGLLKGKEHMGQMQKGKGAK